MSLRTFIAFSIAASALAAPATAALTEDEIARLDADLTPLGAERGGNADGSIPAWDGGITTPPAGYTPGRHHPDPFAGDAPLFTITPANMDQYADRLSAGQKTLLRTYRSYKMPVYPARRSASCPQRVYDATRAVAATAHLVNDGNNVADALVGIPFPIPKSGQEAIWNHLLRFRGVAMRRTISQAAPTRGGAYTLVDFDDEVLVNYSRPDITTETLENTLIYFKQEVLGPARLAGSILVVNETMDQVAEPRRAWVYNVGQRRVRRAPNVAYDNPGTAADNMRTSDQFDMFNGAIDRYSWELVGKREMIVPYNSYRLHSDKVGVKDIITPLHINQDLTRYELHRVWVVEAKLRDGTKHIYPRRTFLIDEDSWQVLVVDQYDTRGEVWRVSEAHCINYYEVPTFWSTLEVHTDVIAGRYLAIGLDNERKVYDFTIARTPEDFTPNALRRAGVR
jgi:hypothetical protein